MRLGQQGIELKRSLRCRAHQRQGRFGKDGVGPERTWNVLKSGPVRLSQPRIAKGERGIPGNGLSNN